MIEFLPLITVSGYILYILTNDNCADWRGL